MTNAQLFFAIAGVTIGVIGAQTVLLILYMNSRFGSLNQRFDDMRDLWRAELGRVEEVIDARLKQPPMVQSNWETLPPKIEMQGQGYSLDPSTWRKSEKPEWPIDRGNR